MTTRMTLAALAATLVVCACGGGGSGGSGGTTPTNPNPGGTVTPPTQPTTGGTTQPPTTTKAAWTVFVYGHGDHNLSNSLFTDILEMASATLSDRVNVIVIADYNASAVNRRTGEPFPTGTEFYRITGRGQPNGGIELVGRGEELNLDDPLVLAAAVETVVETYPADRYGVILWDHGGSWTQGFGSDSADGTTHGTGMSAAQVAAAIRNGLVAAGMTGVRPLEFVAFDTCLMAGNEVAFEFREVAKTYLAAAEIDFGDGWNYTASLGYLAANPAATAQQFAVHEVADWDAHHGTAEADDRKDEPWAEPRAAHGHVAS